MQQLVDALDVAGLLAGELLAGPGQLPQGLHLRRGREARSDQSVGNKVGQPCGDFHVRFAARHRLDVLSIGQHEYDIRLAQDGPDRLPVDAGRLHGDVGHAMAGQPADRRSKSDVVVANVSTWRSTREPSAKRAQATTVSLWKSSPAQRGYEHLHHHLPSRTAPAGSLRKRTLASCSHPCGLGTIGGAREAPGQTKCLVPG